MVPESSHRTDNHCAVFPVGLMERPVKATCPPGGVVLDPFSGTGTSVLVALQQSRRAVGIDISPTYTRTAAERIKTYMKTANERLVPLAA